jgi:sec-independent protein translocase protein TatC
MALDQVDVDQIEESGVKEMTFFDHLEELRMHILRALLGIVVAAVLLFVFQKWFFAYIIFGPTHADFISYRAICDLSNWAGLGDRMCFSPPEFRKQAIGFGEAFITSIKVSIIGGIIAAFPYVFWEIWSFIRPGLYP